MKLINILALTTASISVVAAAPNIIRPNNEETFNKAIFKSNKTTLINYVSSSDDEYKGIDSDHYQVFHVIDEHDPNFQTVELDCDEHPIICTKQLINSTPSLRLFRNDCGKVSPGYPVPSSLNFNNPKDEEVTEIFEFLLTIDQHCQNLRDGLIPDQIEENNDN